VLKSLIISIVAVAFFIPASGQSPTATPPQNDDVVKIQTSLIQVDATVMDGKGQPVRDLKKEDFEIYENGKKQVITNVSFVSGERVKEVKKPAANDLPDAPMPPAVFRPESVRRAIAIIVDDLTMSATSSHYARRALRKFVDEQMQDGDLVAIVRTGSSIGALQQFTADKRRLYAAIEMIKWNPAGLGGLSNFAPLDTDTPVEDDESGQGSGGNRSDAGKDREVTDFRESIFARGTLNAIRLIVNGMDRLPGRKSIMLLSDGFKLFNKDAQGFTDESRIQAMLERVTELANRAAVVIYTIDPRGLAITGLMSSDNPFGRTQGQIRQVESGRRGHLFDTQDGLRYLAEQTGGISFRNNNDISGGIRRILDDQSYYLIAYEPDGDTFDPAKRRFNKLEVKVTRPDTDVRYRSGFFGVSDEDRPAVRVPETASQRLFEAIASPFNVNDITLNLIALFGNTRQDGSFVRSLMHIDARNISFTDAPNGDKVSTIDLVAVCFGDNGQIVDQVGHHVDLKIPKNRFKQVLKTGLIHDFTVKMAKPGAYQLSIALSDAVTKKTGSASQFIEIPDLKKRRLTLSGMLVVNTPMEIWTKRNAGPTDQSGTAVDPLGDTSRRKFQRNSAVDYGLTILNAKTGSNGRPDLSYTTRIFRNGELFFDGRQKPVPVTAGTDPQRVGLSSSLMLEGGVATGDYVLQIIVTDNLVKGKKRVATQFVQFEVVE